MGRAEDVACGTASARKGDTSFGELYALISGAWAGLAVVGDTMAVVQGLGEGVLLGVFVVPGSGLLLRDLELGHTKESTRKRKRFMQAHGTRVIEARVPI